MNKREPITPTIVAMISRSVGVGRLLLDLHLTDYSRGALQVSPQEKAFWLTDGRRVTCSTGGGAVIASVSKEPDPDRPERLEEAGE